MYVVFESFDDVCDVFNADLRDIIRRPRPTNETNETNGGRGTGGKETSNSVLLMLHFTSNVAPLHRRATANTNFVSD